MTRSLASVFVSGAPRITALPPPRGKSAAAFFRVMPWERARTSLNAASSVSYTRIRKPPAAGPSVVEWIAMNPVMSASGYVIFRTVSWLGTVSVSISIGRDPLFGWAISMDRA